MVDISKANYKLNENKKLTVSKGDNVEYEDAEPEVEYSNLPKDVQEYIFKLCKEKLSKILFK